MWPRRMRAALKAVAAAACATNVVLASAQGIPVVDTVAIQNLIQQVAYWQQQISAMQSQLAQLQQTYGSMTGNRGMQSLLPMTYDQRNYLPPDYASLMATVNGQAPGYAGLSTQIQNVMAANAVLSTQQLNAMSPQQRQLVEDGRKSAAMLAALSQTAYQGTSQRFAALQQLITAIGGAGDSKAIQDLEGRVSAEQAMLHNEQTKLQLLYQMAEADRWGQEQRMREQAMSDVGSVRSLSNVPY